MSASASTTPGVSYGFSIVIPTYQRRALVAANVAALARQEFTGGFEVIVVVDGSTDGTAAALQSLTVPFPRPVVEQVNSGSAAARNHGASLARGAVLIFLDDDMEAHPRLLAEHAKSHRDGADAVMGHIPLHPNSPPGLLSDGVGKWAEARAARLRQAGAEVRLEDMLTGQLSVARETFDRLVGFDTRFRQQFTSGKADTDFGRRLHESGYRVVFNPEAISWQQYVVPPRAYLRQWRENGRADVRFVQKHPDAFDATFSAKKLRERRWWLVGPLAVAARWFVIRRLEQGRTDGRTVRWLRRVRYREYWRGVAAAGGMTAARRGTAPSAGV